MATNDDNVIIMPETTGDTSSSVAFDGSGSTFHQREAFYREDFGAFYRRFLEIDEMERRCCASDKYCYSFSSYSLIKFLNAN